MAVLDRKKVKELYGRFYWDFFDLKDYTDKMKLYYQHDQEMFDVYYWLAKETVNKIISLLNKIY